MALKNLGLSRRRKLRPSPVNVIIATLKRFGVSAPVTTATAIMKGLRSEGYGFSTGPRPFKNEA